MLNNTIINANECFPIKGGNELFSTYQGSRTKVFCSFLKRTHQWLNVTSYFFKKLQNEITAKTDMRRKEHFVQEAQVASPMEQSNIYSF